MARVNAISEGQPITYDVLNQIIQEVNKIKDIPEDFGQAISVFGPGIRQSEEQAVKIVAGKFDFSVKAGEINTTIDPKFVDGGNFSNDNVIVVASVVDKVFGKGAGGIQMATVTVTSIGSTGFSAKVQILKSVKQNSPLELHYIAIGAGPKNS